MKDRKNIINGVLIFLGIMLALWGIWKITTVPANVEVKDIPINEADHVIGPDDAPITLVEFSDLQCPACKSYDPLVKEILEQNPETVRFTYKHFPLDFHANAKISAYAAEAAGLQDAFYEMQELLFERQEEWAEMKDPSETFTSYAEELELDIEKFSSDITSEEVKKKVETDLNIGITSGVKATPSFFLNGTLLRNPGSLEGFQNLIDTELEKLGYDNDSMDNEAVEQEDTEASESGNTANE